MIHVSLVVLRGQPQGKCLVFPRGEFVIGRGDECHIRPNSSWVSRQHCILRVDGEHAHLRDLGSINGTLINGARIKGEHALAHGDQIQVGPLVFEVRVEDPEPAVSQIETKVHCLDTKEAQALTDCASDAKAVNEKTNTMPSLPLAQT